MIDKLGHFELRDQIGEGGMGTVFKAFDPSLQRDVAIKLLDGNLAQDPTFVADFIREAQHAAAISHPHIVQIYFVGEDAGSFYIVMELLTGRSLACIFEQDGPLSEPLALSIALQMAEATKAAYAKKMIHGDIKPQNIILTEEHGAKLLDFGLAKLAHMEDEPGRAWGSAYYVSPERVGRKAEDFRSDMYSLGATIFEALTGRPPFEAETIELLTMKRLEEEAPLLRSRNPALSKQTEKILQRMLGRTPESRYPSHDSLIYELREAEAAVAKRSRETAGRKRAYPIKLAITAMCAGLGLGFILLARKSHKEAAVINPSLGASQEASPTGSSPRDKSPSPAGMAVVATPEPTAAATPVASPSPSSQNIAATNPSPAISPMLSATTASASPIAPTGTPMPEPAAATPEPAVPPAPETPSTPAPLPTPETVDVAALASAPGDWPRNVTLKQAVTFPAVVNGTVSGEVKLSAGMQVTLTKVSAGAVDLEFQGGTQSVPVASTDLIERVLAERRRRGR